MFGDKRRWNSIRWRIVLIYFLLVFIAMTITGVFIMDQLKAYQMEQTKNNFSKIVQENILFLQEYDNLNDYQEAIQQDLTTWAESIREEMFVVDDSFQIVASSNLNYIGKNGLEVLGQSLLVKGLTGQVAEMDDVLPSGIPVKNMAFPIEKNGEVIGVCCIRADISSVYDMQEQSKSIFGHAMMLALLITLILGFFIARSITVPINDLTEKAEKMSRGDFSQEVSVHSDDEIGRLAEMFNLLRERLDFTLSEISSEKNKLEAILKNLADGVLAVDLYGRVILANPAVSQMLKGRVTDIEGYDCDELLGKHDPKLEFQHIQEACKEGGGHELLALNGRIFALRFDQFGEKDDPESKIIILLQDITEQQQLEDMQRDFVANVSHELKTPLTTIKSYTETLLDGALEDKETAKHFLTVVDGEADRMNHLVKELLQLSRLDYKQEKWYMKEGNLVNLVKSSITKTERLAQVKQQKIIPLFDTEKRIMVDMDKDRIEQVIINVISNAIKYSPEGKRIWIDVYRQEKDACVIIRDEGIGIPEESLPRIFERFYRVDKARSREMGGTGLGLAISRQIIEEHKGSIDVRSRLGQGTTVSIRLPLAYSRGVENIE